MWEVVPGRVLQEVVGGGVEMPQLMPAGTLALPGCPCRRPLSGERDWPRVRPGLPQRNQTQHKLWPRLPFLCHQDSEQRTPRSWLLSDGERVFHLDGQYEPRL